MQSNDIYTVGGLKYKLYKGHYIDDCMIKGQYSESWTYRWIKNKLNKQSVAVDIGANFGCFSVLMANYAKYVYCFEPMLIFKRIIENMELNHFENYSVFNCVVGDENKDVIANFQEEWSSCSENDLINVKMVTLDSIIKEKIDFIKIDVDGKELLVINGMKEILKEYKPIICQELAVKTFAFDGTTWSKERDDNICNWEEILETYFSLGYKIKGQSFGKNSTSVNELKNLIFKYSAKSSIDVLLEIT